MRRIALVVALVVLTTSAVVIAGWLVDLPALTRFRSGWPPVAPAAAIAFVLAGLALACQSLHAPRPDVSGNSPVLRVVGDLCAGAVALIGLLWFADLTGVVRSHESLSRWASGNPPRMSAATAANFALLGTALIGAARAQWLSWAQRVALVSIALTWLGVSRFLVGIEATASPSSMAMPTGVLFLLLAIGILCRDPQTSFIQKLSRDTVGGALARYLLPAALVVPPLIGWASAYAVEQQILSTYSTLALFALAGAVLLVSLVWSSADRIDVIEKEKRQAQEALLAGQERTRLILENALDAVVSIDSAGHITGCNPGAEDLFGWREQELVGRTLAATIVPPRYRQAHTLGLRHHVETGERRILSRRIEVSALRRDGSEFPAEVSITRIASSGGIEFSAFIRDITERKASENRLRTQLDRLTLLDRITRAVNERTDLSSVYATVLASLEQHLGVDFAAFLAYEGGDTSFVVHALGDRSRTQAEPLGLTPGTRIPVKEGLERSLQGEIAHERDLVNSPVPFARRLGESGLGALVVAPVLHENRLTGALLAARRPGAPLTSTDCEFLRQLSDNVALAAHQAQLVNNLQIAYSDLRRTEQALVQQERLRAYGQLASGVAHDINNSLSPASLALGLVLENENGLTEDGRRHVDLALQSIENASQTIARMREFYRRRDESPTEHRPVDLNKTIDSALALTRARWHDLPQQRGTVIDLVRELAPDLPKIDAVDSEVRDALTNLILNAADAMPDGGALTLRSRLIEDRIAVEIEDSGTGMDERTRQHCIEPFFTTKGDRGTGLGLATVYGMAERHSAKLQIDSAPGVGTRVRIEFPIPSVKSAPQTPQTVPLPRRQRKVLLVDDDEAVLITVREVLARDGHEIVAVNDPRTVPDIVRDHENSGAPFDVVVTDLGMPYMDGKAVAQTVKQANPTTAVILLTGWGHSLELDAAPPPNVDKTLGKPPQLAELRRVVSEITAA